MDYNHALEYINSATRYGIKPGLSRIKELLKRLGNPHKEGRYIHVVGTNGKGSTCAFISNILVESGYKTGMFTSPFVEEFLERIKVDNINITEDEFVKIVEILKPTIENMIKEGYEHPTVFEMITAVAFIHFKNADCDLIVLEAGMGGRLDSTNVIDESIISVITSIDIDHTEILGKTIEEIAEKKAGIIKNNGTVVSWPQKDKAMKVIEDKCIRTNAKLIIPEFNKIKFDKFTLKGQKVYLPNIGIVNIPLLGQYQMFNATLAVELINQLKVKEFHISNKNIIKGIEGVSWPGRMEIISHNPVFIVDGAHNPAGVKGVLDSLDIYFPDKKKYYILGMMKDKDVKTVSRIIGNSAEGVFCIQSQNERAINAKDLAKYIKPYCNNVHYSVKIMVAVKKLIKLANEDDIICSFGSFYNVSTIKKAVKSLKG